LLKNRKNRRALGATPPDGLASCGSALLQTPWPRAAENLLPASSGWGLCPQSPTCLRRLHPLVPKSAPL